VPLRAEGATPSFPSERPLKLDVSGSYEPSPMAVIFRDAAFGMLAGAAVGGAVGAAADSKNWGRDLAIGAGAGLLLGILIGAYDSANSGPRISVHADVDQQRPEGSPAFSAQTMVIGQRF
jgi:hypothetical protein